MDSPNISSTPPTPDQGERAPQPHAIQARGLPGLSIARGVVAVLVASTIGAIAFLVYGSSALTEEQSRLATVFMNGEWVESDLLLDDTSAWTGSGVIIGQEAGELIIMTNSHCLALPDIVAGQLETPDIARYGLGVCLANDTAPRPVRRFAETSAPGLDLALLRIDATGLRRGVDFEIAPIHSRSIATNGLKTVAIGAPLGFRGTETFGQVSAIRTVTNDGTIEMVQTDAAINPGNSGGPLFLMQSGGRVLLAINTFGLRDAESLNFAHFADEYYSHEWKWFEANPAGAVKALREIYGFEAEEAR